MSFRNAQKSWEETCDLASSLADTLNALGHGATFKRARVALDNGFTLLPQVVNVEPLENAGVNTVTTIQTSHPTLIPRGVFEFQHSSGADLHSSFAAGFKGWAELDLPVFLDALRPAPTTCMTATMEPDRRLIFGPPVQMAQKNHPIRGDHDFCPCCLFTKNVEAFGELLRDPHFHGLRLFVSRDAQGHIEADCRVNGIDMPAGAAALLRYAQDWPDRGAEYRKQYVGIQTRAPAGS